MLKKLLLTTAATLVIAGPAYAQTVVDSTVTYTNNIATSHTNNSTYNSDTMLMGDVTISGEIEVDSAATAMSDTKQIANGQSVMVSEGDEDDGDAADNGMSTNITDQVDVNASGNSHVNIAAGHFNQQSNVGTIAVASSDSEDEGEGGWAKANTTSIQEVAGTFHGAMEGDGEDDNTSSMESNFARVGDIGGAGNIGVNSAAGAFNQQQNVMTLAVATDSSLADASAGIVQHSEIGRAHL